MDYGKRQCTMKSSALTVRLIKNEKFGLFTSAAACGLPIVKVDFLCILIDNDIEAG